MKIIDSKELIFQNEEKEKRAAELVIANKELLFQNTEKEKRAAELVIANEELLFQNTEKEKRAAELVIANKELSIAATAFESQTGIMVTDANNTILRVNTAFTAITGYMAEEVVGQTPAILNSGHQDKVFYEVMWETLSRTALWEGEIWNRRKNGEVYIQYLTIKRLKDANGDTTNFVATLLDITQSINPLDASSTRHDFAITFHSFGRRDGTDFTYRTMGARYDLCAT